MVCFLHADQRAAINRIGKDSGCHVCGTREPGTRSGDFICDFQLPDAFNPPGKAQRLYPICLGCSGRQGSWIAGHVRGRR